MMGTRARSANFASGPAQLPDVVLRQAADAMLDITKDGNSVSIAELGHRTAAYQNIQANVIENLTKLLKIPNSHSVLLIPGGGTMQFSAIPMNLFPSSGGTADYIITGSWSQKAAHEAAKYGHINVVFDGNTSAYTSAPRGALSFSENPSYIYYCANETINGVAMEIPCGPANVPIVADCSSSLLTRPIPPDHFPRLGVVYAASQKIFGPAGICVVIVRNDLIGKARPSTPILLDYQTYLSSKSIYNTPPTISIYIVGLTLKWIITEGGVEIMEKRLLEKSKILYNAINKSKLFSCPVDRNCRSQTTIVLKIKDPNEGLLLKKFLSEGEAVGLIGLAGHRSVGGIRVALFNAQPLDNVKALVEFMQQFEKRQKGTD